MLPSHSPPILVLSRKKPHLLFFQVLVILSGLSVFLIPDDASDVPAWVARIWGVCLLVTGAVCLAAHLQRWDRERGMYVERGSLSLQAGIVMLYVSILTMFIPWGATIIIALLTAIFWAGANLWEVKLISNDLKMINAVRAVTPNSVTSPEVTDAA